MPTHVKQGSAWRPVKELFVNRADSWTPVHHAFVKRSGSWVGIYEAVAVATVASTTTNLDAKTLFAAADWSNPNKKKRLIIPAGVTIGATSTVLAALRTGTGRQGALEIIVNGEVQGAGGATSGAAGGAAINIEQSNVTVFVNGAVRGGGGAGGVGGTGGGGAYNVVTNNGFQASYNEWYWTGKPDVFRIYWNGVLVVNTKYSSVGGVSSYTIGGYTYTRYNGNANGTSFAISRYYTAYSTGGAGGAGGRGTGYNTPAVVGSAGSAGGTNAGAGGTGGNGGGWGFPGGNGASGANSGVAPGAIGASGGAAGPAITGLPRTVVSTGTINGTF